MLVQRVDSGESHVSRNATWGMSGQGWSEKFKWFLAPETHVTAIFTLTAGRDYDACLRPA